MLNVNPTDLNKSATLCPCGSTLTYAACCGIYHSGQALPNTAARLMRSRYSAFVCKQREYLLQTWAEATRPKQLDIADDTTIWSELQIISTIAGGEQEVKGSVEFKAFYELGGKRFVLHELSQFVREQNRWVYVDGLIKANGLVAGSKPPAKNSPCTCGSGKKFKRCCEADA